MQRTEVTFLIKGNPNKQTEIVSGGYMQAVNQIKMKYGESNVTILGYRNA